MKPNDFGNPESTSWIWSRCLWFGGEGGRWVSHDSAVVGYCGMLCWLVIVVTRMPLSSNKADGKRSNPTHITQKEVSRRVIPYGGSILQFSVVFNALYMIRRKPLHPAKWIGEAPTRQPSVHCPLKSQLSNIVPTFSYGQIYHFLSLIRQFSFRRRIGDDPYDSNFGIE